MFKRSVIAMACIFPLSACGGGGGGSPDVKSADTPSKPAAPVVAENAGEGVLPKEKKDEEAAGGAPQADTQDATAGEGSQDMAAVSAENTGNGGAATTDNPKNEDAGAQNDMPQNAAESANQTGNNQPAGSSDSAPASNPAPANGGSDFGRTNVGNSVVIDGPSQNITLTHCKGDPCNGDNLLDEEAPPKSEFESLSDEEKIKKYKKDGEKFTGLVAIKVENNGLNKYTIIYQAQPTRSARSRRSLPAEIPLIPVNQADTLIVDGEAVSLTGAFRQYLRARRELPVSDLRGGKIARRIVCPPCARRTGKRRNACWHGRVQRRSAAFPYGKRPSVPVRRQVCRKSRFRQQICGRHYRQRR